MRPIQLNTHDHINSDVEVDYMLMTSFNDIYTRCHSHDFFEFFIILNGRIEHIVNTVPITMGKGTLVFMRPNDVHYYKKVGSEDCQLLNIAVKEETIFALLNYLGPGFHPKRLTDPAIPPSVILSEGELEDLMARFETLNLLNQENLLTQRTEWRILLVEIFARHFNIFENKPSHYPEWMSQLIQKMQRPENLKGGLKRLNALSYRTQEHVCRSFMKYLKQSPSEFIHDLRLKTAANLLIRTNKKVTDIAFDLGYENLSYFYQRFKKHFKQSPGDFRHLHRRSLIPVE